VLQAEQAVQALQDGLGGTGAIAVVAFFRPVRKLLSKRRVGSKVVKRYDAARTPYQRVLAAGGLTPEQRQALAQQVHALDPIALARDIQQTLDVLWKLADTRRAPQEAARG
jgi:hypothetical protein